jgi:hypothetical protein
VSLVFRRRANSSDGKVMPGIEHLGFILKIDRQTGGTYSFGG